MNVVTDSQIERNEAESVLQSGIFAKSARLERFFRYIVEQHFAGRAEHIKEYSIALEALGRPSTFDPKKDSIVRVEAHRLRKRLEQFYREEGASHAVHLVIPNGQYRPSFVAKEATQALPPAIVPQIPEAVPPRVDIETAVEPVSGKPEVAGTVALPSRNWQRYVRIAAWAVLALTACGLIVFKFIVPAARRKAAASTSAGNEIWSGPANEPAAAESRILAGYHGPPFVDRQGHTWSADAYYHGGVSSAIQPGYFVECGPDPRVLKGRRAGRFSYDIPLRPGAYELHLYFAETEFGQGNPGGGGDSTRIFQVSINGITRLEGFDPLAEAGSPNRLLDRVFKDVVPAADGKLHLKFEPDSNAAFLNAIELVPSAPGRTLPVRIVAQSGPVTDSDGRLWAADEYYSGGITVTRQNAVVNPSERAIYQGERFGNFSYRIPVAPGKYRLTLHFAETYFGTYAFQDDPVDRRIFNVFVNGTALLRDFDIAKEAGGPNRGLEKVFDNLEPNAQGMLLVEFIPVKNYAEVNGIEVVEVE
jgi:hypothetical protein